MATLSRLDALKIIAAAYADCPIVVTLGATARELAGAARADNHLYVLDSMGLPPAIGLGLALGLEDRPVAKTVVIEGDGSLLMGLSSLATVGLTQARKLLLIVLDNAVYAATGGQATAAGAVDFVALAASCGLKSRRAESGDELSRVLRELREADGPTLLYVPITQQSTPMPYLLEDPVLLGADFARWLQRASAG